MRRLAYALEIETSPDRIWRQLTDFEGFPEWNPFIRRASGRLAVGERIRVTLKLGRAERTFRPTLVQVDPNRELRWRVRVGVPGIFDVERIFQIEPLGPGRSRFAQSEVCTGVLTPLLFLGGKLERDILRGYEDFARTLKERLERGAIAGPGERAPGSLA